MKIRLLLILLSSPAFVFAQTVQGIVTDAVTGAPLYLVSVMNDKTQVATTTDKNGVYTLSGKSGDKIRFSYVGYSPVVKYIPPSVIVATINVALDVNPAELETVVFKQKLTKYQLDSIERAQVYKLPMQRTKPSPMSPASAVAELFSKKAKRTYEFQKEFKKTEREKFIESRYTQQLVGKVTGATGDSISCFMAAYPMPYDYARTATDLEIKMWIRSNYKLWLTDTAKGPTKMTK